MKVSTTSYDTRRSWKRNSNTSGKIRLSGVSWIILRTTSGCLLGASQAKACATPEMPDRQSGEIMRCSKCGSDNREGRKFCTTCGTLLVVSCPKCGPPIQPGDRFCGGC